MVDRREHQTGGEMTAPRGLLLSDDLIFTSRVTATARAHGLTVDVARTPARLMEMASASLPTGVILDLHCPGLDLPAAMAALRGLPTAPTVVGYGSHVDAAGLRAARQAGCDRVMPRSQFVAELETHLADWITPKAQG